LLLGCPLTRCCLHTYAPLHCPSPRLQAANDTLAELIADPEDRKPPVLHMRDDHPAESFWERDMQSHPCENRQTHNAVRIEAWAGAAAAAGYSAGFRDDDTEWDRGRKIGAFKGRVRDLQNRRIDGQQRSGSRGGSASPSPQKAMGFGTRARAAGGIAVPPGPDRGGGVQERGARRDKEERGRPDWEGLFSSMAMSRVSSEEPRGGLAGNHFGRVLGPVVSDKSDLSSDDGDTPEIEYLFADEMSEVTEEEMLDAGKRAREVARNVRRAAHARVLDYNNYLKLDLLLSAQV